MTQLITLNIHYGDLSCKVCMSVFSYVWIFTLCQIPNRNSHISVAFNWYESITENFYFFSQFVSIHMPTNPIHLLILFFWALRLSAGVNHKFGIILDIQNWYPKRMDNFKLGQFNEDYTKKIMTSFLWIKNWLRIIEKAKNCKWNYK